MMYPKGKVIQLKPDVHRMKRETDSEPVLVSVELDLISHGGSAANTTFKEPLVLNSLPCSPKKAARDTLIDGFESVLPYMPSARFGNLVTADRREIDGFRRIANTVDDWYRNDTESKPLSIAVFGQPGSGKSFGVKEVIKSILAANGKGITDLEFNLSQFRKEDDLRQAFEVIRDKALSHEVPIVFFDEFDSTFEGRELGWLKHFISPITDGKYKDGEAKRPLGRGIYIFIGGTKTKYEDFFGNVPASGDGPGDFTGQSPSFQTPEDGLKEFLGGIDLNRAGAAEPTLTYMELDMSMMSRYNQLKKKFYEIRDKALVGDIPVVFFRNFDGEFGAEKLGWLKYFLAPMQDGEFFDHGSRHPIGRAIFVFEQGTPHFNGFPQTQLRYADHPGAKLPDFVSRLRGYVRNGGGYDSLKNVLTWYLKDDKANKPLSIGLFQSCREPPDPLLKVKKAFNDALKGYVDILGPSDLGGEDHEYFAIRRAMLLRSMLERIFKFDKGKEIDMDPHVLNALLFTPSVLHGARSLESILAMSNISPGHRIETIHLCEEDQRILHVNDPKFQDYLGSGEVPSDPRDTPENKRHYAWIERKSGRVYKHKA
ncbi:hypothetical protein AbraIFM66951_000010 [Aspergillus brasiliensis]|uniref:ATPase AAA-type core domain-containing protein n=1 Tax=Aspergillus brasiliensis TaxID=319629 RepID=A0A9W6DMV3_9EURO|nr:hypothetical protein AbraCBS73388_009449 [Aspergillus brasiliensis]GKZ40250.1 hypothetical protein AbraIFM66951_000010 [Aspergillus brasiliensis]